MTIGQTLYDDLIEFFPLTEGAGTTITGLVSGLTGTLTAGSSGSAPAWHDSTWGKSLGFDGGYGAAGNYVTLAALGYHPRKGLTLSCWITSTSTADPRTIWEAAVVGGVWLALVQLGGGKVAFRWHTSNGPAYVAVQTDATVANGEHHVAVTWDGTYCQIYVDGVAGIASPGNNAANPIDIVLLGSIMGGYCSGYANTAWNGYVGPLGFWARCLSAAEVRTLALVASPLPSQHVATNPLVNFTPAITSTVAQLNALWAASPLASLIGARTWSKTVTVSSTIAAALATLSGSDGTDASHRVAVFIPNGIYSETVDLDVGATRQYIDLIGASRDGVIIAYNVNDANPCIAASGCDSLVANLTCKRSDYQQYPIHNDGASTAGSRTIIFLNLKCLSLGGNTKQGGIGTGTDTGEHHWFLSCAANAGFYAHNGLTAQAAASYLWFIDCTGGAGPQFTIPPPYGLRYGNCGTGKPDQLHVLGGKYLGSSAGVSIENLGTPYAGASETLLYTDQVDARGSAADWSIVANTVQYDAVGGVAPCVVPKVRASALGLTAGTLKLAASVDDVTGTLESTDPGVANVVNGTSYKIESATKSGTLNIAADNPPGQAGVIGLGI